MPFWWAVHRYLFIFTESSTVFCALKKIEATLLLQVEKGGAHQPEMLAETKRIHVSSHLQLQFYQLVKHTQNLQCIPRWR